MQLIIAKDYGDMCRKAANIISAQIILKPDSVLGLTAGSTPIGIYNQLIKWYKQGDLDFSKVKFVNLDEYKGLAPDNPQSYHYFMRENLFRHVNIGLDNTFLPDGLTKDSEEECRRFDKVIQFLGGIDLQLLGLGRNGHLGFNEPEEFFEKGMHCVQLPQPTIDASSRLFQSGNAVPEYAYTMGIRSTLNAKKILLVVSGSEKADVLKKVIDSPITTKVPASILQLHSDITVIADTKACSML